MLRLISSFLVLMLGATASPRRGARSRTVLRPRRSSDDEKAADRTLEATERPRARSRQFQRSWPGAVELVHETHTVQVSGTWTLDNTPFFRGGTHTASYEATSFPDVANDRNAWAERMRTVLSLQEPATRLRVGEVNADGWQTLELAVPTRPPTIVQVDRSALGRLLDGAVTVRLRIDA